MPASKTNSLKSPTNLLLLAGILLVAINLRPALASIGPLVEDIRAATGLSNSALGLLTTLPLIAFSVVSVFTPFFTKRFGTGGTVLGAMALLTLGIALRSLAGVPGLFIGTLLAGIAIAFGNVLLPSLTKQHFNANSGFVTSLYSAMMAGGAALAAGMSVPLAQNFGLGWRGSLAVWAGFSFLAFLLWFPQIFRLKKTVATRNYFAAMKKLIGSRSAWQVALFMGLQSLTFYVILAWLPTILQSRSFDAATAGWLLSLSQATGILGSLIIPILAGRSNDQRGIVLFLCVVELLSLVGLLLPHPGLITVWVIALGFVLGGTFGLSLLFIVLCSNDAESATELSGMAQSIGYFVAGMGPIIFGGIYDLFGNWNYPFVLLFGAVFLKLLMGWGAGKPRD